MYKDEDEDDEVSSRERVADFISGVLQAQVHTPLGHSDIAVIKHQFTVHDVHEAHNFFSLFCIVKNISSAYGFVI